MTGYSGEFIRAEMLTSAVSFIQKPFTPADLGCKIRKLLADPRDSALVDNKPTKVEREPPDDSGIAISSR